MRKQAIRKLFIFPLHLSSASALPGRTRNAKMASFYSNAVITALPDFSRSLFDFFSLVDTQTHTLLHNSLNLVMSGVQLYRLLVAIAKKKGKL